METTAADMTTEEAEAILETRTHPRVTVESIKDKIASREFIRHDLLTICVCKTVTGFLVLGKSAPASPENFSLELGQKYAFDDCIKQLFQLEGYALKEKLYLQSIEEE